MIPFIQRLFHNEQVLLIGEEHNSLDDRIEQAKMIRKFKPDIVFMEGLEGIKPYSKRAERILEPYKNPSLQYVAKNAGIELPKLTSKHIDDLRTAYFIGLKEQTDSLELFMSSEEATKSVLESAKKQGKYPENMQDVLTKSLYSFDISVLKRLTEIIVQPVMRIELRKLTKEDFENPDFIPNKTIKDYMGFALTVLELHNSYGGSLVFQACSDINTTIGGCSFQRTIPAAEIKTKDDLEQYSVQLEKKIHEEDCAFETSMGEEIAFYAKQGKRIVLRIGKGHLEEDSHIISLLNKENISCRVKLQSSKDSQREYFNGEGARYLLYLADKQRHSYNLSE